MAWRRLRWSAASASALAAAATTAAVATGVALWRRPSGSERVGQAQAEAAASGPEATPGGLPVPESAVPQLPLPRGPQAKQRLVVLGSGWGAVGLIKSLPPDLYEVTVVSDRNYFLFTPLLPSITVGALDTAAVVENMHSICKRARARFALATATDVDTKAQTVTVLDSQGRSGQLPYDILVLAIGARSITWGTPGVEQNCHFLKTVSDAQAIRQHMLELFELASLPHTTDEQRRKLLSFVIVGGGPTVLNDFLHADLAYAFPDLVANFAKVTIVQSADHILNTYAACISKFAEKRFLDDKIKLLVNARVNKVEPGAITMSFKGVDGPPQRIEFGLCVWSTGVGPQPLAQKLMNQLDQQVNTRALVTDDRLRVKGLQNVYAIGDCATIELPRLLRSAVDLFVAADTNHNGTLDVAEFEALTTKISRKHPLLREHMASARKLFEESDVNHDGVLTQEEFSEILQKVDVKLTALPATAQVASQQGVYLARQLAAHGATHDPLVEYPPFAYRHLGAMAYIGHNNAVVEFSESLWSGGFGAFLLWRSAYMSRQVSLNTRINLALEWAKRPFVGRNLSKY